MVLARNKAIRLSSVKHSATTIHHHHHTRKNNIYHSNKWGRPFKQMGTTTSFFHSDTNPALGHVLVHSVDKTHALVVTVGLVLFLFLNILFFNFVPTSNKSLWFTRFRISYVNCNAVVLTIHCQSCQRFYLDMRCSKGSGSFF